MSEPLERYSRVNDRLLDGCEVAYTAIADEFHSDSPDWSALVGQEVTLEVRLSDAMLRVHEVGRAHHLEEVPLPRREVAHVRRFGRLVDERREDVLGGVVVGGGGHGSNGVSDGLRTASRRLAES